MSGAFYHDVCLTHINTNSDCFRVFGFWRITICEIHSVGPVTLSITSSLSSLFSYFSTFALRWNGTQLCLHAVSSTVRSIWSITGSPVNRPMPSLMPGYLFRMFGTVSATHCIVSTWGRTVRTLSASAVDLPSSAGASPFITSSSAVSVRWPMHISVCISPLHGIGAEQYGWTFQVHLYAVAPLWMSKSAMLLLMMLHVAPESITMSTMTPLAVTSVFALPHTS